jgi:hypothetical protein
MKYLLIIVAMSATGAIGVFAKDDTADGYKKASPNTASSNIAEPKKLIPANGKQAASDEQKAVRTTETLERIKEKDKVLYKALTELKKKDLVAFEAVMGEILQRFHAESDKGKDGFKGKEKETGHEHLGHMPRPYQNQLDCLPDNGHNADG